VSYGRVQITIVRPVASRLAKDLTRLAMEMMNGGRYRDASRLLFAAGKFAGSRIPLRPYTPRET